MNKYKGIFPALLTPFDSSDRVNKKALQDLVNYNLQKGVKGFYVDGSTAEAFLLSQDERKYIMEIVSGAAAGRCTLIAHVGCISTKHSIELARHAQELGYDAISSVAPFYYKFTFEEIKKYYLDIVDAVNLPMFIYNIPVYSGVNLTVENINEFLNDERFIGVKHTSTDFFTLERIKKMHSDKIIFNGYDENFLAGLAMGADGAVGSTFNFMAEKFIKIMEYFNNGEIAKAQKLQCEANNIIQALIKVGVMAGTKEILNIMDFDFGYTRAPLRRLTQDETEYLKQAVRDSL
jgi:N-acetylneuraminate lyase